MMSNLPTVNLYGDSQSLITNIQTALQVMTEKSVVSAQETYENTLRFIERRQDNISVIQQILTLMMYENNVKLNLSTFNPEIANHLIKLLADNQTKDNRTSIDSLIKLVRYDKSVSIVTDILFYFISSSSAKEKPQHEELFRIAALIVNQYPFMYITDIIYGLQNGVLGNYGELYNKIDAASIIKWIKVIGNKRQEDIEAAHAATKEGRGDEKIVSPTEKKFQELDEYRKQLLAKAKIREDVFGKDTENQK